MKAYQSNHQPQIKEIQTKTLSLTQVNDQISGNSVNDSGLNNSCLITGNLTVIDSSHAQVVINYPGKRNSKSVIVCSNTEAQLVVNHETRIYITDIFCQWLGQRIVYFNYIKDNNRAAIAGAFINGMHSKRSLEGLVDLLIRREGTITFLAPGISSKFYKTYFTVILPVLQIIKDELKSGRHE